MAKHRKSRKSRRRGHRKAKYRVVRRGRARTISYHRKLSSAKKAARRAARRAGKGKTARVVGPAGKTVAVCTPKSCSA